VQLGFDNFLQPQDDPSLEREAGFSFCTFPVDFFLKVLETRNELKYRAFAVLSWLTQ